MFIGRHPEEGEAGPPRLLIDTWEEGGDRHLLLVAQGGQGSVATLVVHSPAQRFWEGATAIVRNFPDSYDRAALLRELRIQGIGRIDLVRLGLLGKRATLADEIAEQMALSPLAMEGDGSLRAGPASSKAGNHGERIDRAGREAGMAADGGIHGMPRMDIPAMAPADRVQAQGRAVRDLPPRHLIEGHHGFESEAGMPVLNVGRPFLVLERLPAGDATPNTVLDLPGHSGRQAIELVEDALKGQASFIAGPEDRAALDILGPVNWTERAHGFLSCGGRVGERRRQAARLYPAFAVTLSTDRDACAAIDASRPFEKALLENVRKIASPGTREGLTLAALRRLRVLPATTEFRDIAVAMEIAAQLPLDWLPKGAPAWEAAIKAVRPMMGPCLFAGLRLDDLSHHVSGALTVLEGSIPDTRSESEVENERRLHAMGLRTTRVIAPHAAALHGARDMADRLADTLVSHACQSLGIAAGREEIRRIAGAVLFSGKALPAVHRLQKDWHAGIPRLDAALPSHEAGNAWPRLVPDFVAANGLVVACLTNEAQLKAEGMRGPDVDGIEGLHHCVGGYGRRCYGGETHVFSVRRPVGDAFERVSTVEIQVLPEREGNPDRLMVLQHYGMRNREACQPSYHAVTEMLHAVMAGDLPLDPEACGRRSSAGFRDAYDWRVPGVLDQAMAAWAEYLPGDVAAGGLDALRARVLEEARFIAACGGSVHMPETLPAPEPDDGELRPGF